MRERALSENPYRLRTLFQKMWEDYFKQPLDTLPRLWQRFYPNDRAIHPILREYFFACAWNEVYDFIEFVYNNCPYQFRGDAEREAQSFNDILTRELSAYRLVGGRIVEITSKAELDAVEQALDTPFQPVNRHMQSALDFLADRKAPDYRNSIKESISAVEAMCQLVSGQPKATLGQALGKIESSTKVKIHSALKDAFSKMYGYTNDAEGIRHALLEEPTLEFEDAKFMLVACSAFINYLKAKLT